jgi:hypothetical protein
MKTRHNKLVLYIVLGFSFFATDAMAQQSYPACGLGRTANRFVTGSDVWVREALEAAALCVSPSPTASCSSNDRRRVILRYLQIRRADDQSDVGACIRSCEWAISMARQSRLNEDDLSFFYLTGNLKTACTGANGMWQMSVCIESRWSGCTTWMNLPRR